MSGRRAKQLRGVTRADVHQLLHRFVVELRAILKRRGPEVYRRWPNMKRPCATCAFNPSTDSWKGADATAYNLWRAISNDQPFYCHENMVRRPGGWDPTTVPSLELCGGYAAVIGEPETKTAFMRAVLGPGSPLATLLGKRRHDDARADRGTGDTPLPAVRNHDAV